jgi:hypothetical protein
MMDVLNGTLSSSGVSTVWVVPVFENFAKNVLLEAAGVCLDILYSLWVHMGLSPPNFGRQHALPYRPGCEKLLLTPNV